MQFLPIHRRGQPSVFKRRSIFQSIPPATHLRRREIPSTMETPSRNSDLYANREREEEAKLVLLICERPSHYCSEKYFASPLSQEAMEGKYFHPAVVKNDRPKELEASNGVK
ncbi:hypothetical protein CDAR_252511 [Caerostris darwini]|uniref:Uncharacterized protein n=1 Tax=Caerostris darwini TaxID=1538125 RepID=A0AAV4WK38_9ARAC|nr:hypothetical protein CDAR_252511 [Caerostris darwini]